MLLFYSNNCLANNDDTSPSTGEVFVLDSTIIDIKYIKLANAKMIERKYLLSVVNEQDSIISLKNIYITEQNNIINDLQNRIVESNNINNIINSDLQKEKLKNKFIIGGSAISIISLILGIIFK